MDAIDARYGEIILHARCGMTLKHTDQISNDTRAHPTEGAARLKGKAMTISGPM